MHFLIAIATNTDSSFILLYFVPGPAVDEEIILAARFHKPKNKRSSSKISVLYLIETTRARQFPQLWLFIIVLFVPSCYLGISCDKMLFPTVDVL